MMLDKNVILNISKNTKEWKVIQSEEYAPDRENFILNEFNITFPDYTTDSIERVYAICSRSTSLAEWLAGINIKYAANAVIPLWLKENVKPDEFKKAQDNMTALSKLQAKRAQRELEASQKFKKSMTEIKAEFEKQATPLLNSNLVKILNIKSSDMPIALQFAIHDYVPAEAADAPDKRVYAREVLTRYKIALLQWCKENPEKDIQPIIESERLK